MTKIPKGWVQLKQGRVILEGDYFLSDEGAWFSCKNYVSKLVGDNSETRDYRVIRFQEIWCDHISYGHGSSATHWWRSNGANVATNVMFCMYAGPHDQLFHGDKELGLSLPLTEQETNE